VIVSLAACHNETTTPDAALRSLTNIEFSQQYTSAFWDAERTNQSTLWNEAWAYCHNPVHRLAPNCRIVNAVVEETNPAEDEEAVALVREALRAENQRRGRQAWEGLGFGGVMSPEQRASASTRREPAAKDRVHASHE
jgi:hypothetical protein